MDKLLISRISLLISLIILLLTFNLVDKTNCQDCELEVEGRKLDGREFTRVYFNKCIFPFKNPTFLDINFSEVNISEV